DLKIEEFMSLRPCPACGGARLRAESRAVLVGGARIEDFCALSARRALEWLQEVELSEIDRHVARLILREISERLQFLENVGIGYLSMDRAASTLSGGEAQRIRLATQIESVPESLTGQFLSGARSIETPARRRAPSGHVEILGASQHNLRDIDVLIPLGVLTCVTGVSGSGKSTLVNDVLFKALANRLHRARKRPGAHRARHGLEQLDKIST